VEALAARTAGNLDQSEQIHLRAIADADRTGNQVAAMNHEALLAGLYWMRGISEAYTALDQRNSDNRDRLWLSVRSRRALFSGDVEAALALLPSVEEAGGVPLIVSQMRGLRASVFANLGRNVEASTEYRAMADAVLANGRRGLAVGAGVVGFDVGGFSAGETLGDGFAWRFATDAEREALREIIHEPRGFFRARVWGLGSMQRMLADNGVGLDMLDDAERLYEDGLTWCESEQCGVEAGRCHQGLAVVAGRRGDTESATQHLDAAGELFSQHGAKYYLDQVIAKKEILKA